MAGVLAVTLSGCVITPGVPAPVARRRRVEQDGVEQGGVRQGGGELEVEAGVLKGRAVGADGRPIQGVEIAADNQLLYNSNLIVSTDADGFYQVDTNIATTFRVTARMKIDFNGTKYLVELTPENDASFAGPAGAVRNFTWKLTGERADGLGHYGSSVLFYLDTVDPQNPEVYLDDQNVEVTLTPEGPLIDGSQGQPITRKAIRTRTGLAWWTSPSAATGSARTTRDARSRSACATAGSTPPRSSRTSPSTSAPSTGSSSR